MPRKAARADHETRVSSPRVDRRLFDAKFVYTIGPGDPLWDCTRIPGNFEWNRDVKIEGAIFRLKPPEGVDPAPLKAALERSKAAAVRVVAPYRSRAVPRAAEFHKPRGAREVVMEMANEAKYQRDPAALREVLEAALAAAGL
jgi:hypothetical protein